MTPTHTPVGHFTKYEVNDVEVTGNAFSATSAEFIWVWCGFPVRLARNPLDARIYSVERIQYAINRRAGARVCGSRVR